MTCAASLMLAGGSVVAAPGNDNFNNAMVLSASTLGKALAGSNVGATAEPGEPQFISFSSEKSPKLGGKSVWWKLTPASSSTVTVSTAGSSFDTQLAVYTGGTVSNLTAVADNDDAVGSTDGHSELTFTANAGTVYHILVDGYAGAEGSVALTVTGVGGVGGIDPPTVTITAPAANTKTTNGSITVTGTAKSGDTNDPLAQVLVSVNGGTNVLADGTTNWTATVNLNPGTNVIQANSVNSSGSESPPATRNVTFLFPSVLTIQTNGPGTVTPAVNGKSFYVGSVVKLQAVPAQNAFFSGWTGSTNSTNAVLNFVMTTNAVLTANFTVQPFTLVQGSYNGLVLNDTPTFGNSGFFTMTVNRNRTFSGHLIVGGKTFNFSKGQFDTNGFADLSSTQGGTNLHTVLQLDMTNQSDQVTGTVTGPDFTSALLGDRATFDAKTNISPFAGMDNMILQHNDVIGGDGPVTLTVNAGGVLTLSGKLVDGTSFSQSVPVSKSGAWPLFASLYNNKGAVFGWMTFSNLPSTSIVGTADWFKPPTQVNAFTNGVSTNMDVIGSLVITPPASGPILNWATGIAVLSGDDFMMPLTNMITLRSNNTFVSTFQLNSFQVTPDNRGVLRGSFVHPVTQHKDALTGVELPKTNWGGGFFLDTNGPGLMFLGETLPTDTNAVITPPATLDGASLTLVPNTKTQSGAFKSFGAAATFAFTATNVTSNIGTNNSFGSGIYTYSSQPSTDVMNVVELNIANGIVNGHPAVMRMLLNFLTDTSGTYLASLTAGSSGTSTGVFTVTPPVIVTPPATP